MPWMSVIGRGEAPWPGADASMDEAGAVRPRGGRPAAACKPAAARVGAGRSAAARIGGEAASHSDGRASGRVQA